MLTDTLNTRAAELPIETGVDKQDREKLAESLNRALSSTYVLYAKTHAYHWNVAGPLFYSVHKLTDEQYRDLAAAADQIAERIRAIGFPALAGLSTFVEKSLVSDAQDPVPTTREMVETLARNHQELAGQLRDVVRAADGVGDVYTADLLTSRIGVHEEAAWMLTALLSE